MRRSVLFRVLPILLGGAASVIAAGVADFKVGQEVQLLRFGEWLDGRVARLSDTQVMVMLPLADGRYDPNTSFVIAALPHTEVRPRVGPTPPKVTATSGYQVGQEVQLLRWGEWLDGRVASLSDTQVMVMLPLADGRYDPSTSYVIAGVPGTQVRPRPTGIPAPPAPSASPVKAAVPAPVAGPVSAPRLPPAPAPAPTRTPATPTLAPAPVRVAAPDPRTRLVGVWLTAGHTVVNVVKEERVDSTHIRQTKEVGGGHVGGHVEVRADGTFFRLAPSGKKFTGRWKTHQEPYFPAGGIVLEGADEATGWGPDMVLSPKGEDEIMLQAFPAGGAGFVGWRAPDPSRLDLSMKTEVGYFTRAWTLTRKRIAPLKTEFGILTLSGDGTWSHQDGAVRTLGRWEVGQGFDGLVVRAFREEGDYRLERSPDRPGNATLAGMGPGNTHILYYAR